MNEELKKKREALEKARETMAKVFKEAGPNMDMSKVTSLNGTSVEKVAAIQKMNDDQTKIAKEIESIEKLEKTKLDLEAAQKAGKDAHRPPHAGAGEPKGYEGKSIGQLFAESKARAPKGKSVECTFDVSLKTLFQTTAGWPTETTRTGKLVEDAQRPVQVTQIIPMGQTGQSSVVYMEETTFTNAAAETAEGGTFPESTLALTEQSSAVRKIAVIIPVTDEQLEDVPQVSGYLDNRLRFMLMQRLDSQILNGNGTAPNLRGILNVVGIQTQAKGADPVPDAIHKAMTLVRVTGRAMPNWTLLHPNDWQEIRLLTTADGIYIWGSPSEAGPERIWGLPVLQTDALPENTGLVGDFRQFIELTERRGITVKVSDSNGTDFEEGKQAIRADVRVALPVYRPAAFCTVTGI